MASSDLVERVPTVISDVSVIPDDPDDILASIWACVYPVAVVKTVLAPHVILPVLSIEHMVVVPLFIVRGLDVSDVTNTNGGRLVDAVIFAW